MSSSSVKGLMKGLRYISQMFEREKEEEIEIGFPTNVKHVAHIGNDGSSSSNTPSWMNEFKGCSDTSSAALRNGKPPAKSTTRDSKGQGTRDIQKNSLESPKRGKKKQSGSGSPLVIQKPRRNKSSSIESPGKKQNLKDPNVATKPTRRKKKGGGSAGEGSTRSRSKVSEPQSTGLSYSDPGSCKGEVG